MDDIAVRTDFPRKVREIENTWIQMPDGVRLAARIWLPEDADKDPVPAILEYLPYRKRDGTVERDHLTHPYFAGHGYASVRVDMRGTGDSEGLCLGEYLQQEQDDALAVIDWLTRQDWCSGAVGMIGISWGGFNGLQVAARQPDARKAGVTICSTDDRYADDIHFMGGAILTDKLCWGATAFSIAMTPPDPAIVGAAWRDMWLDRLNGNGHWMFDWFRHQRRDDFYRHGSICEDYDAIRCPVLAVGGWADGYTNTVFRMMENLTVPCKGLIGPWAHKYPHFAPPGPRIGFLQECLRWWDQHLKGQDTGIMDEPMLRAWMQDPARPDPGRDTWPGYWGAEAAWPPDNQTEMVLHVGAAGLTPRPATGEDIVLDHPKPAGLAAQDWFMYGPYPDGPADQRLEGDRGAVFETPPLDAGIEILGFPRLTAQISSDKPVAQIGAVLSAVNPDGSATLISYGVLNLTHRDSHAVPEPMPQGVPQTIKIQLNACGQQVAAGQKLRLALSNAYWPVIWPAPRRAALTLSAGSIQLTLPTRDPGRDNGLAVTFLPPEGAEPLAREMLSKPETYRRFAQDPQTGTETLERLTDGGAQRHLHTGLVVHDVKSDRLSIDPDDPNSARGVCRWRKSYSRDDWSAEVETETRVQALVDVWRLSARVIARENGEVIFSKDFAEDISRDLV